MGILEKFLREEIPPTINQNRLVMSTKETIKDLTRRMYCLNATEPTEAFVEMYWKVKEELSETLRLWSYTAKSPKYPQTMREDLNDLNRHLDIAWHKICEAGLN